MVKREFPIESVRVRGSTNDWVITNLRETVFHVTTQNNFSGIVQASEIRPNVDGAFPSRFGDRSNGFFRKRGCVSLFDLRDVDDETLERQLMKCRPLGTSFGFYDAIVLVVSRAVHPRLISWERWKDEKAYSDMVVPHVEAGHEGGISLDEVDRVYRVSLN